MFISINVNKHWHVTKITLIWAPYSDNKQYTPVIKYQLYQVYPLFLEFSSGSRETVVHFSYVFRLFLYNIYYL